MHTKYTIGSCFSGIGGFELGLESTGFFKTIWQIERDSFCQKVLKKHWPDVLKYRDINEVNIHELEKPWILVGGYPCQPFSFAGTRQGNEDDRHLWPKMFEIIKIKRPNWVICENVYGHVSMGLDQVLTDLENEAYSCQTFIVPACAVDAPHRRDRVWILGSNTNHLPSTQQKFQYQRPKICDGSSTNRLESGKAVAHPNSRGAVPTKQQKTYSTKNKQKNRVRVRTTGLCSSVADTNKQRYEKHNTSTFSKKQRLNRWKVYFSRRCWLPEPPIHRTLNGFPSGLDKNRLKGLGNAVVPQIIHQIGLAIIETEKQLSGE